MLPAALALRLACRPPLPVLVAGVSPFLTFLAGAPFIMLTAFPMDILSYLLITRAMPAVASAVKTATTKALKYHW